MARTNTSNIPNSEEFLQINGEPPERHEATAWARWQAARKDWGGVVEGEDIGEPEQDALDYVAQHIGFGEAIVYLNVRAAPVHGPMWVAYPEAGKAIRAPLSFLTDPARDDNTIARMQIKAVRGGHAFEVYNTVVPMIFRQKPEDN